jgi:hypothetical protein
VERVFEPTEQRSINNDTKSVICITLVWGIEGSGLGANANAVACNYSKCFPIVSGSCVVMSAASRYPAAQR